MNKILLFIIFSFLTLPAYSDMGTKWPSESEMAKATLWPEKYTGNPSSCKKFNESLFIKYQEEIGYVDDEKFTIESHVDLNLDGTCEIIAYQRAYCGNKQCGYVAFHLNNNEIINIGDIFLGEYLAPRNGWLQIRGSSYSGYDYSLHLLQYKNGAYKYIKTDRFRYDEKSNKTEYITSEEYK